MLSVATARPAARLVKGQRLVRLRFQGRKLILSNYLG